MSRCRPPEMFIAVVTVSQRGFYGEGGGQIDGNRG
jgi:hypothetical protein